MSELGDQKVTRGQKYVRCVKGSAGRLRPCHFSTAFLSHHAGPRDTMTGHCHPPASGVGGVRRGSTVVAQAMGSVGLPQTDELQFALYLVPQREKIKIKNPGRGCGGISSIIPKKNLNKI